MERSGFFDANLVGQEYDRVYLSNDFASYFASFIGNGIFGGKSDELQVVAMSEPAMQVRVKGGQGWINGYWYENNDELYLPITVADGILSRIDSVVLRLDLTSREIHLAIKEGTLAFEPVAPGLQRSIDCYELQLATVSVPAGAANVQQVNITDTRLNTKVCGLVCGLVKQFDTTEFGKQLETFISDYITKADEDYKEFESEMQSLLDELEEIASSGDVGSLVVKVDDLRDDVDANKIDIDANKRNIEELMEGEDISVTNSTTILNSHDGRFLFEEIDGVSEQKKYSGKNLIPLPHFVSYPYTNAGVTYTYDDKTGYITANGTANSPSYDYSVLNVQNRNDSSNPFYLPKGKYKLTGCPKNGSSSTYCINAGYTKTDGTYGHYGSTDIGDGLEFEVTDETRPIQVQIKIKNGYTANNLVFKPMITNADIVDDSFEPYVGGIPAPNPSYPQEIKKSVINVVKTSGKNLIHYPYDKLAQSGPVTHRGITFTDNGDGSISAKGTPTNTNPSVTDLRVYKYLPAGTYTVSDDASKGYVGVSIFFYSLVDGVYVNYTGEQEGLVVGISNDTKFVYTTANGSIPTPNNLYGYKKTFTIKEGAYVTIQVRSMTSSYTSEVDDICYPMLSRAEVTDDTWEVYKESSIVLSQPIELCGIEVTANDDYTYEKDGKYYISDTIEMIDGEYKKVQRIGKKVFDGINEVCTYVNNSVAGATETLVQINLGNGNTWANSKYSTRTIMSDKAILFYHVNAASCFRYGIRQSDTNGTCCLYIGLDDGVTDIETANAWLQSNPITIFYVLANPIITSLPTADQMALNSLVTFEGITYLKFDSEIEPTFSGEYGTTDLGIHALESLSVARKLVAEKYETIVSGDFSHAEGYYTESRGNNSHAEGSNTLASGLNSHAEGYCTTASGDNSHAEGSNTTASGDNSRAEGRNTTASGEDSHAGGHLSEASGQNSYAHGFGATASEYCSHSVGRATIASASYSHAEGFGAKACGNTSHAEGYYTESSGDCSHTEGNLSKASGDYTHAEGHTTEATGNGSHAEGYYSVASGTISHAEGSNTTAEGANSHAEGKYTTASGETSHAEGVHAIASGSVSHAEGYGTVALDYQHAQGHYNDTSSATANSSEGTSSGTAFVIGNGTYSSAANAFRVTGQGKVYATSTTISSGADYAEYFEFEDGNLNGEDRVGYFITFSNKRKVRIANSDDDFILGISSGNPCVLGNGDECWRRRYIMDDFDRFIEETFEDHIVDEKTGEERIEKGTKWKENPEYDKSKDYVPRDKRKEWIPVGMIGVLPVYDDGTCIENGYCTVSEGGIATMCEYDGNNVNRVYRVLERVSDNVVRVLFR